MSVVRRSRLLAVACAPPTSKSSALQLLVGNAFIQQSGTGLFSLLPLGQRVVARLTELIERELDALGAQKVSLPFLGSKEMWEKSGRWDAMGSELLKCKDRLGKEFCLQPTAEEMMADIVGSHSLPAPSVYPLMLYQTTPKFRDEMNPRFGLVRGRMFLMNDLYSFDKTPELAAESYQRVCDAYGRILRDRLGLQTFKVRASSGIHGGTVSHEYHLRNGLEEDAMEVCEGCGTYYKAGEASGSCCEGAKRRRVSSIEVAHTFQLGTKYSAALKAYAGHDRQPLEMCCFGIGVTRLFAAIVEQLSRGTTKVKGGAQQGLVHLPVCIQPFDVVVVPSRTFVDSPLLESLLADLKRRLRTEDRPTPAVLIDDRYELSLGKRVQQAQQIGVSRVVVLGKGTSAARDDGDAQFEFWSADPMKSEKIAHRGDLTRAELLQAIAN